MQGLFFLSGMERRLASLRAEVSMPERVKFTAPLLFLHGLWTGGWIWQEVAWALSQRGWESWALDLRGRPGSRPVTDIGKVRLEEYVEDVIVATRHLWASPIVCGYDLGALLALLAGPHLTPRALVCLAPLCPRSWIADGRPPLPLVRLPAVPALLWSRPLPPPRRRVAFDFLFNTLSRPEQRALQPRLAPDSGTVARTLLRSHVPFPEGGVTCPVLIVNGTADRMSPASASRWLAKRLHAEHREYLDQGHWLFTRSHSSQFVTDLHRWLIVTLGEALLVPPEEEDERTD